MRTLLTVITLNLAMLFVAMQAQAISPVKEAKAKDYMEIAMPIIKIAYACKWEEKHDLLEGTMKVAYSKAGATDDMDKMIVDMWYTGVEMEYDYGGSDASNGIKWLKANPNNADAKQQCANLYNEVKDSILTTINY